ncbi:peptidase [Candidatus Woesebacteria bacterium RIFCSPLOWO2_01_FULL_39_21]|uniref:Peptidase n=1 Tax=Candidatus Woesebacteria bacterium RIFCSPLOWO2_01_FULL_39_21 TaxID=1802519 RepID=A0A1F8BFQ9_9BACT|nr:MAG: peptidase [Candidatus Woesebacteria bacterium RIFCSPHIGHO2_01_FULL_39_23]OGM62148.1 MAG: peptidase [Candidatus Woesebacteria bacterium RIFCSPLOWO2_01_FULL_39_21]
MSIEALREGEYPGSDIAIEQTLSPGSNYQRYIASYKSEGLKIYGLLTVPNGSPTAESGWPAIVFNHGYISPSVYKTTEKYVIYQDAFARAGYVTFKSDFRGHGNSEGTATGGYGTNDYTIDVLNAVSTIKKYSQVDPNRIGMWGHSMGGHITLEAMVVGRDIKAGVIWAGVTGSYSDLFERWRRSPIPGNTSLTRQRGRWRQELSSKYGTPEQNPDFWEALSATSYLSDISGPLQLHHGAADSSVPIEFSQNLESQLKEAGKDVELFVYNGDDHNLSKNLSLALTRSVDFFDKHLKEGGE